MVHLRPALGFISGVGVADANNSRCLEGERKALLEFKNDLVDDYGSLSSWRSEDEYKNCCNWEGVYCSNQTGHVLELKLYHHGFQGIISPSLLKLPYLTSLNLSYNIHLNRSHFPEFISSLSNLKHLDLSVTRLNGTIPHHLGNFLHLQFLHLGGNDLTVDNLEWLSHLSSIEDLDLTTTNLSVANDWLEVVSRLPNLTTLRMTSCNLPQLSPSSFPHFNYSKSFTSLESLDLSTNQLEGGIPKFLGDICTLRKLVLLDNNLNGQLIELINNLSRCAKHSLEVLDFSMNQFTGLLPNFTIFPSLKEVHLFSNNINGTVPKSIGNLYKLEVLDVSSNFLQGVISEAHFSNLSKLRFLDLSNNFLALEFNFDWVPPFQLDEIYLSFCKLGLRFPNWIQTQRSVSILDLSNANISINIQTEWFMNLPPTLGVLNLSCNQIHGRLPNASIRSPHGLTIDLSANCIGGPLPLFPTNLTSLNLSKNRFSGSILSLCQINSPLLTYLDLSDNTFFGHIPNCLMHMHELVVLNLAGNNFSGEVPSSLGWLSKLETLKLSNNNFSGDLPSSLKNCSYLRVIDLGLNRFSGKVPIWIGEGLPILIVLSLHSNKFDGNIPLNLCWMKKLQFLDLSLNDISGTIPSCLNNLTAMAQKGDSSDYIITGFCTFSYYEDYTSLVQYVDSITAVSKGREDEYGKNLGLLIMINLSGNKLTGNLPIEISSLLELVTSNVSGNNLIGEIPHLIGQLKKLETFVKESVFRRNPIEHVRDKLFEPPRPIVQPFVWENSFRHSTTKL